MTHRLTDAQRAWLERSDPAGLDAPRLLANLYEARLEVVALRAAARDLVEALPRCGHGGCNKIATRVDHIPYERDHFTCDAHADLSGYAKDADWAGPVRLLSALLENG